MNTLQLGIVGAGMIARVIARAVDRSGSVELAAVASRRRESAAAFAEEHGVARVFGTWRDMLASASVDAVYVATPTSAKEEIAIAAANAGKHVLVDKPFADLPSLERIVGAAHDNGVAFMDATHFPHHPRTAQIRQSVAAEIGEPQAVRSAFFFPSVDRDNIRYNAAQEPTGALGDMGWYSMRAIVEYLQPTADLAAVGGSLVRDPVTGTVVRGAGFLAFADGKTSTFDFGYNAGACLMDLDILGHSGAFTLNDFVLDWKDGFDAGRADHEVGYMKRVGVRHPREIEYVSAGSELPQAVMMMENFAGFTVNPRSPPARRLAERSIRTQELLDSYRDAVY